MFWRAFVVLLVSLSIAPRAEAKELPPGFKKEQKRALSLYAKESYKEAVRAFRKALSMLEETPNRDAEIETRKYLVLALYNSDQKDDAVKAYRALKQLAPSFEWDPDEVLPETISFLSGAETREAPPKAREKSAPKETLKVSPTPAEPAADANEAIDAAPGAPRDIKPALSTDGTARPTRQWKWYYLTPLGIGQYLAGSPVRATILLVLQAGFAAMNIAGYVLYHREFIYGDDTVRDGRAALRGQTVMNVGFFGIIGSVLAGTIDGAFFEP
jgi:tetratricopeptide (TPR) repeat protein